ncbi:MAG: hypothetical protein Q8O57_06090, partial [Kiritimatiellota bacterium]|nr:hypothetical protein [Kiritimatiellota bacterium]
VTPVFPFEDIAVNTSPTQLVERARATLRSEYSWGGWGGVMNNAGAIAWSRVPIIAARLGMKDDMKEILTKHSICSHVYPMTPDFDNELGIVRFEYGAIVIAALNEALLQSHHGLSQVFPAWPDGCDARFKLLAEGNVLVEAERKGSNITFVALQSIPGGPVTLLNPWPGRAVRVSDEPGLIQGDRLTFNAGRGVTHVLSPVDRRVKRVPKMTLLPRASDIKSIRFVKGDKTYQAHLGLDQADLPANPEVKLPVGPLAFSSPADVSNRFISGWYQDALPQCMTWSEKYEGSLMLTGMTGRVEQVNATFIGAAGKSAFGNVVMEADFMSEKTSVFGFFVRQQEKMHSSGWRHSIESYRAVLSFASPTDAWIRFGGPDASLDVKAVGPLKVAYVEGQPYRLRLTVRNLPGKPVRYASFKLEVFAPGQAQAVSGEWVANLTADNRPNCGEIGIYMKPNTGKDVDGRLYVRRFTIREAGF